METYLCIFCSKNPASWSDSISHAEFTHNYHPHSITNPWNPPSISCWDVNPMLYPQWLPIPMETRLKTLFAARNEALAAHELVRQVMSSCSQWGFKPFSKGDKIWLEVKNLKHLISNLKFAPKQEGTFTITKVLSSIIYQLLFPKTGKTHPVFHAYVLTPYKENAVHEQNFPMPPPDFINGKKAYEIEKVIRHCGSPTSHFFLIQWIGYLAKEDSWIPEWNLKHAKSALTTLYKKPHSTVFLPASSSY